MRYSFAFSNLLGSVYCEGNLTFLGRTDSLLSPVGRRLTLFDLKRNSSRTFPFESNKNIERVAVSPDESLIITVDRGGRALLVSLLKSAVLHHFNFKHPVEDIKYSQCGSFFANTLGRRVQVWHCPGHTKEFAPFKLFCTFSGFHDDTVWVDWSYDSRFIVVGSKDMTARIYNVGDSPRYQPVTLSGHRTSLVACFFQGQSLNVYTIAKDCAVYVWHVRKQEDQAVEALTQTTSDTDFVPATKRAKLDHKWELVDRHLFLQKHTTVSCAQLHHARDLLVLGYTNGVFSLYEMQDFQEIHSFSVSNQTITSVSVNQTGEWLAFGCAGIGQLVVWEWQSESFILKQQGHYYDVNVLAYSPDGQWIATGGGDGKVKMWDTVSGFCFVTFHKHTAAVTGVEFGNAGQFIMSSSLDGTIRAFDLHRYRNFRTFTSPRPVQFSCVAVGKSSDIVCAGSQDSFDVFLWSVQTGRLLEVLSGHNGPVSSLAVGVSNGIIASASWDKTVRVWDVFERKGAVEVFHLNSDALALSFSPDGHELAVSTLDGNVSLWNIDSSTQLGTLECHRDMCEGKYKKNKQRYFASLSYSSDGSLLLAGGRSRFVCLYSVCEQVLLKKFKLSEAVSKKALLASEGWSEASALTVEGGSDSDREDIALPGVLKGDMSERRSIPEIRTNCIQFSPTDQSWAVGTNEGLLIYSLDQKLTFNPYDLTESVTPDAILEALTAQELNRALTMSLKLNELSVIQHVIEAIPLANIDTVTDSLLDQQLDILLRFVASQLESSRHLELYLTWCSVLLNKYTRNLKQRSSTVSTIVQILQRNLSRHLNDLGSLVSGNTYLLEFLVSLGDNFPDGN
ncbi:periodic tryptophan protein 2 homolog [Corticium candelabrum]|uniref:periodic tryptophan protein 2 homolog n=1 Tax=Corticium candelabrum TaxID=121492 RepID=UPI002E273160|nr:periodic tryptophan protein 2 homolog [Corticium candelabrum]